MHPQPPQKYRQGGQTRYEKPGDQKLPGVAAPVCEASLSLVNPSQGLGPGTVSMARTALGIAFSLQLLVSVIQGRRDVELFHHPTLDAVAGDSVALPCILKAPADLNVASIEWRKNDHKLVVFHPHLGENLLWPNVTFRAEKNDQDKLMGSSLLLTGVTEWDSGVYTCDITSFPLGSIKGETRLTVRDDIEVQCDGNGTVEVHYGGNASVCCRAGARAEYRWTKDQQLVSETGSLELWQVTDAHAGVYQLTVSTGNTSLHLDFIITVLAAATSVKPGEPSFIITVLAAATSVKPGESSFIITVLAAATSVKPDAVTVTLQGLPESASSSLATSPTSGLPAALNRTVHPGTGNLGLTTAERITSSIDSAATSSRPASSPATLSEAARPLHPAASTDGVSARVTAVTPDQEPAGDEATTAATLHPGVGGEDPGTSGPSGPSGPSGGSNNSRPPEPPSVTGPVLFPGNGGAGRTHLFLVLTVVPVLLLISAVGFFFKRHIMKKRMDLPPPFIPPPPPIKYAAAQRCETTIYSFAVSRCNSVADPKEMRQMLV
ncbi:uncharacterized protein si:ch1073-15f19.2 [Cololabis saira]|uniref:uncharacterized protein si:ch1073-15f19.2 n=1 Tax=Cololabis saira TaxID=129043 RepID=UPI002AD29754|nr:uncharacterized protein si:ch1073-15f19.2 [Cololabis saira]